MPQKLNCAISKTVLEGALITGVLWENPVADTDSGFRCWSEADDELDDETYANSRCLVCLHCLIEEHPEAGALMDRARIDGWAIAGE